MFELFRAGGPLMWPLLLCSVVALTIIVERFWALSATSVAPADLVEKIKDLLAAAEVDSDRLKLIANHSPLGEILAAGIKNIAHGRDAMKESIEEAGRHVVHDLGRYLNTLGTIAVICPLIGLLGTVIGMIRVFTAITVSGVGDPGILSGGISEALITTATGLSIGIPALMFHRYFKGRVNRLTVRLEQHAVHLVDAIRAGNDDEDD
ncbi:MAG: MotA/TolQ/ExbB proton channel family protein [Proteobacteria bacterium]|jgi:biopolymer transport protein ExbB|nr:MotA/TolQ/ExbB proton channel family protein [Pseudomonadota bacterium]